METGAKNSDQNFSIDSYEKSGSETESKTILNIESHQPNKIPYPKRVFFIIGNEFCERFNFYGMKAILAFYMSDKLGYSEDNATVLYHVFTMSVYFMCIFGGVISDVWLGKFNTIAYLSIIYSIGSVVISIGAIPAVGAAAGTLFIGLLLIAIGSGGIKPCVSAFGGDQFKLPEQTAQFATFFSIFYFSINLGSVISTTVTPILRADVHCFGDNDCFPLAFGLPAILMIVSVVFFLIGKSTYTYVKTSSENMLIRVTKCISNAISTKIREGKTNPRENLLDYSVDEYGPELVNDIRSLSKILILYLPLPFFWSLFDQQGSRWTYQAKKMNGDIGFTVMKPDQMQMVNPLLILAFIPLFDSVMYPLLSKVGIRRPLQKLTLGGILAGIAFLLSALVQFQIESSPENSINMMWLIPQYVVMTMGEVMFSVTGLSFSYEQAPESMKSVVTSFWLLTVAFGNLIFIFVAEFQIFEKRSYEFLLFSGLMFVDMIIFVFLAKRYKSSKISPELESKELKMPLSTLEEKTAL